MRDVPVAAPAKRISINSPEAFLARPLQFPSAIPSYVTFGPGSVSLDGPALARLDMQARYMLQNQQFFFQLFGHSDVFGPTDFNKRIALARAQTVRQYLLSRGVSRRQLLPVISKGEGEQLDLDVNQSQLNRRVVTELYNPI